jgi:hypothetical protein
MSCAAKAIDFYVIQFTALKGVHRVAASGGTTLQPRYC